MAIDPIVYGYVVKEEKYPDKAVIIEEGSKGEWAYVVLKGEVKVIKMAPKGLIAIDTLGEGAVFGEMAMFMRGSGIRTASVVAHGPALIGVLDSARLFDAYASIPAQIKSLFETMIKRLGDTTKAVTWLVGEKE
jgi:CRP-like cAMP-binding protein